jgi:hypothetical protein
LNKAIAVSPPPVAEIFHLWWGARDSFLISVWIISCFGSPSSTSPGGVGDGLIAGETLRVGFAVIIENYEVIGSEVGVWSGNL